MSAKSLQRAAVRDAALQDAAVAAFNADLRTVYRRLSVLLRAALEQWDVDPAGRTVTTAANLTRVFALRRQARDLVRRAGFDAAARAAIADPLDLLASSVVKAQGQQLGLGPNLREALDAWRDLRLADLLAIADDAARTIQRVVLDGTLGLREVDKLIADVAQALEVSQRAARTTYDTAISIFSRQMEMSTSTGAPDELFVYVGPVDEVMRPFCRQWIGKVRTRDAISALDNGMLPDVIVSGGGWNCRHRWSRVSILDDDLIAIAGTNQRAPGIDALLKEAA